MSDQEDNNVLGVEDDENSIKNVAVRAKYTAAAKIANEVLKLLIDEAKAGKSVLELCELGDKTILEKTAKVFNREDNTDEKIDRGIAFPTSVNVNSIACHYSPLPDDTLALKDGDLVKIDLGVHVDGYAAVVAHTIVVQEEAKPIDGRVADLVHAAQMMLETATRSLKPGKKNNDISPIWEKIAEAYGVNICEGVLSHQMKKFILDGNKTIIGKPGVEEKQKVDDYEFQVGEVWSLDVVLSSGAGKLREGASRCYVYKMCPDKQFKLKLKASKDALNDIKAKFQNFPFTVRALDPKSGRLGVAECLKHELIAPYPVLNEHVGEDVVHFKRTVFIANTIEPATGFAPTQEFVSDKKCEDEDVKTALASSLQAKKKARSKKKTAKKEEEPKE